MEYCNRQLTLFFKRLRKRGCRFRYLAVAELQTDGTPHFHVLLHELKPSSILWKDVHRLWETNGFHKTNLLRGHSELKAVAYACKYLMKTQVARVRCSIRYGDKDRCLDPLSEVKASEAVSPKRETTAVTRVDTPLPATSWFSLASSIRAPPGED
jgi:hypothetical protein